MTNALVTKEGKALRSNVLYRFQEAYQPVCPEITSIAWDTTSIKAASGGLASHGYRRATPSATTGGSIRPLYQQLPHCFRDPYQLVIRELCSARGHP